MTRIPAYKSRLYVLEGANSFAATYFFTYVLFRLSNRYGFGDRANLLVGVCYGLLFTVASWCGGRIGHARGYCPTLRLGFGGMLAGLLIGWAWDSVTGLLTGTAVWTVAMCMTWANLEALVSEGESEADLPNRVGLYNVVWAGAAGVATLVGGWIIHHCGPSSLFWLPAGVHAVQWAATWAFERRRPLFLAAAPASAGVHQSEGDAAHCRGFQRLAWASNSISYMAINTLMVLSPGITARLGLETAAGGALMSLWLHARTAGFALLWFWKGWHYRFRWFAGAYVLLAASFVAILATDSLPVVVAGQLAVGGCVALFYYSALYYSMDGSETHGLHGGIHESIVGLGIFGGPAVCATGVALAGASGPALAMGATLAAGAGLMLRIRGRMAVRA